MGSDLSLARIPHRALARTADPIRARNFGRVNGGQIHHLLRLPAELAGEQAAAKGKRKGGKRWRLAKKM